MNIVCGILSAALVVVGGLGLTLWAAGIIHKPRRDVRAAGRPKRNYVVNPRRRRR